MAMVKKFFVHMSVNYICEYYKEYVFDYRMNNKILGLFVLQENELDKLDDLCK